MYNKQANDVWLNRLRKYVKGKKVIVVGNATSLLNEKQGRYIHNFDVVMRFGRGAPTKLTYEYIGNKTNIWTFGALRANCYKDFDTPFKIFNLVQIPLYIRERYDMGIAKVLLSEEFQIYKDWFLTGTAKQTRELIAAAYGKKDVTESMRMSQGVMMVLWMIHEIKTFKELHIIGFDCMKSVYKFDQNKNKDRYAASWHLPLAKIEGPGGNVHTATEDEQFLIDMETQGKLIWHRTDHTRINTKLLGEISKSYRPGAKNIAGVV